MKTSLKTTTSPNCFEHFIFNNAKKKDGSVLFLHFLINPTVILPFTFTLPVKEQRKASKVHTKDKHGIGKSAEYGKEEATDQARAQDFKQELTAGGKIGCGEKHEVTIDQDEEEVTHCCRCAGHESVRLIT